jgi:hypothetical protein
MVRASGLPPVVDIDNGVNKTISLPAKDLTLFGHAVDPELDPLTIQWSQTSGPAVAAFSAPWALTTTVSFTTPGTYVLQMSVNDGTNTVTASETVTVNAASSQTAFYVDPTYTGGSNDGSAAHPWTSVHTNDAISNSIWPAINAALATQDVIVYFSARQAGSDTPEVATREIDIWRSNTSTHNLTLDGMSKYNQNDATPAWADYTGTNKFQLNIQAGDSLSIGVQGPNNIYPMNHTTIRGFDVSGSTGRVLLAGNYVTLEYVHAHNIVSNGPNLMLQPPVNDYPTCTTLFGNLHDITFRGNTVDHGFGEGIYVSGTYLAANQGGCITYGIANQTHSDILIEGNTIDQTASNGGEPDDIDLKAGLQNVTIRNNELFGGTAATRGIVSTGVFPSVCANFNPVSSANPVLLTTRTNFLIENNRIHDRGGRGIDLNNHNGTIIRNNVIANTAQGGINFATPVGDVCPYAFTNRVEVYNNTIYNMASSFTPNDATLTAFKNNIVAWSTSIALGSDEFVKGTATTVATDYNIYVADSSTGGPAHWGGVWIEGPHSIAVGAGAGTAFFANIAGNDFHLNPGTLPIDHGLDLTATGFTTDLEGRHRPQGPAWDMGAYEFSGTNTTTSPVTVETAPDGSGTVLGAQIITSGASVTGFAIQRDLGGNFVANVAATWSLSNITGGGIVNSDLVPAVDNKSAIFTGHRIGTARVSATASGVTGISGVLSVIAGPATRLGVETAADGSGGIVAGQTLVLGSSVTGFSIQRDTWGNFVANVAATWSLFGPTGNVVAGDLAPAADNMSAVFTAHAVGSASILAVAGGLTGLSGNLTIVAVINAPPTVVITSPVSGATVSGNITVSATASATPAVTAVQFMLDGSALGAALTSAPYFINWNTLSVTNGSHTLTAVGTNLLGSTTSAGVIVTVSNAIPTTRYNIPSNGGVSLVTTDTSTSPLTVSHALVNLDGGFASSVLASYSNYNTAPSSPALMGVAMISLRSNGILVTEEGVPASPQTTSGRVYAEMNTPVDTGIALSNPTGQDATVSFYFTDTSGRDFGSGTLTVPSKHQISGFLDQTPFGGPAGFQGTFTFSSNVAIGSVALRVLTNSRGEVIFTTLPVTPFGAIQGSIIPHFVDGGGWATSIFLTNSSANVESGTIQFLGQGFGSQSAPALTLTVNGSTGQTFGYSLQPHSSARFDTSGTGPAQAGSIQVVPSGGVFTNANLPNAEAIIAYGSNGNIVSELGVTALPTGNSFQAYMETLGTNGQPGSIQSGVAIANGTNQATTVFVNLNPLNGAPFSSNLPTASINVPPNGQIAKFINELFPTLPATFQGIATIYTATGSPISIAALRGRFNERGDFLMTTTPPLIPGAPSSLVFPEIVSGAGYSTQLVLFGSAGAGSLFLMGQDGTLKPSSSLR